MNMAASSLEDKSHKKQFLCLFAQEHSDFRLSELQAIISTMNIDVSFNADNYSNKSPFLVIDSSEEDALKIAERSVLIKYVYELYGNGSSYQNLRDNLERINPAIMEPFTKPDFTFSVRVKAFNKKLKLDYQKDAIEWLSFLPIAGKVDLKNPLYEFHLLEDYGDNPNYAPPNPLQVFFCKLLSSCQRRLIHRYSLKTRHFIGNTSMDPQLSLIMANMAKVLPGSLVYDPFAGTGSILIACAHYGGYIIGSDIDWNIVHGKGRSSRSVSESRWRAKDECVRSNLVQYSLEHCYIDMLVHDASCSIWSGEEIFDAIVTDRRKAPYGIREGVRRMEDLGDVDESVKYGLSSVIADLLGFAAKFLVMGGRLVYWLPCIEKDFDHSFIPTHPCLSLIAISEQMLSNTVSRRLITLEKSFIYDSSSTITDKLDASHLNDFRKKYFRKQ